MEKFVNFQFVIFPFDNCSKYFCSLISSKNTALAICVRGIFHVGNSGDGTEGIMKTQAKENGKTIVAQIISLRPMTMLILKRTRKSNIFPGNDSDLELKSDQCSVNESRCTAAFIHTFCIFVISNT